MLKLDEILQSYDRGEFTRSELIVHLIIVLASVQPEAVEERLRKNADVLESFKDWLDDVAAGAELFLGGHQVHISDETRTAIERFRGRTRGVRYAKLANQMRRWETEVCEGEPGFAPADIEPFRLQNIDALLAEGA